MFQKIIDSKSRTFLLFCFSFLAGIAIASYVSIKLSGVFWYFIFLSFAGLIFVFRKDVKSRFVLIVLLLFVLGIGRYEIAFPKDNEKYISYYNGQEFSFVGYISGEPDVRIEDVRYLVGSEESKGKVYVRTQLYPRYKYGDRVKIDCDLAQPEVFDDFRYDMYLANMGVFSICNNPSLEKIEGRGGSAVFAKIMEYKNIFAGQVNRLWHEPYASFVAGLLYGYRGGLGDLQDYFNKTGISHIVAISGYNISIISVLLITIFVHLWVPRKKAFWIIIFSIFLFVVFAGASGSVVRAGIMGFLALLSKYLGRKNRMANSIIFTAVLMTIHNPFVLAWDVGFQLSFLATVGLVYLSPIFEDKTKMIPDIFSLKTLFLSTMSAIILTFPLVLYQFGRFSIVAPIVNVLVLWLIPFIMFFGFISVLSGFLFFPVGQIFAWLTFFGLKYIVAVAVWFSGLPFASVELKTPLLVVLVFYFLIFVFMFKANKEKSDLP